MQTDHVAPLCELIGRQRDTLLSTWRRQVRELPSAKRLDVPTLNDHIPRLIEELCAALRAQDEETIAEALSEGSPPAHGLQRLEDAFDIEEIVAEYNILRGCVHDLAGAHGLDIRGRPFHIVNRVLDQAIGQAVQAYATQRALEVQHRREEYLSFVAHDIRTPLNAITLAVDVLEHLLAGKESAPQVAQMIRSLGRNAKQVSVLVAKVIEENANLQTEIGVKLERRAFDLWSLVETLIHDLHPVAGTDSTRLVNEVPDDLVAYADASLLRRVFQNLIANAIRYTPRGRVAIGARELDAASGVACWVSDDGTGIAPELIDKVFEKGETDPDGADGMGLGLAIVKTFIEAHGGRLSVTSREGARSRFEFTLPGPAPAQPRT